MIDPAIPIFSRIVGGFVAFLAVLTLSSGALAEELVLTFKGMIDRVILPAGETLLREDVVGATIQGRIVFDVETASRNVIDAQTTWQNSVKELAIGGAIKWTSFGGNLEIEQDTLKISPGYYCGNCRYGGDTIETDDWEYAPSIYLLVQQGVPSADDLRFPEIVKNIEHASAGNQVKGILSYRRIWSGYFTFVRFAITFQDVMIQGE